MGLISTDAANIQGIALVEQASDLATLAARWRLYAKSAGLYQKSPAGVALRLLTETDLSDLTSVYQPVDSDLTALAALNATGFARQAGAGSWSIIGETGSDEVVRKTSPTLTTPKMAKIVAPADGTTAIELTKADGSTPVVTVDTTDGYVGIGNITPVQSLTLNGTRAGLVLFDPGVSTPIAFQHNGAQSAMMRANVYRNAAGTDVIGVTTDPQWDFLMTANTTTDNFLIRRSPPGASVAFVNLLSITGAGLLTETVTDTGTNTSVDVFGAIHNSSGVIAAGFGTGIVLRGQSSTTAAQLMSRLRSIWSTATHVSRKTTSIWSSFDTAERDAIGIGANGSAPLVGFYNISTAPIAQQVLATGAGHTTDDVITALQALGLVKQS